MKLPGSNYSKSSKCSPVPIKTIGLFVAATAERAPPPFAWPSNFVTITYPTLIVSWKAFAYSKHAWPILPSITKIEVSGVIVAST